MRNLRSTTCSINSKWMFYLRLNILLPSEKILTLDGKTIANIRVRSTKQHSPAWIRVLKFTRVLIVCVFVCVGVCVHIQLCVCTWLGVITVSVIMSDVTKSFSRFKFKTYAVHLLNLFSSHLDTANSISTPAQSQMLQRRNKFSTTLKRLLCTTKNEKSNLSELLQFRYTK